MALEWARKTIEANARRRRDHPYRHVPQNAPLLFVDEVAEMLGCSVDQARRIPRDQLPARRGPGKLLLYLQEDVLRYVRELGPRADRYVDHRRRNVGGPA